MDTTAAASVAENGGNMSFILKSLIIPLVVGILGGVGTYLLVSMFSKSGKKKDVKTLGIAIIESLIEEVNTGIIILEQALKAARENETNILPKTVPPRKSWNGMNTIPDDVLIEIINKCQTKKYDGFHPKDIRSHCKNYFEHITANYDNAFKTSLDRMGKQLHWYNPIINEVGSGGASVEATKGVKKLLEDCRDLLS